MELDSFINDEFMITNKGELLIINKKGLDIKIDKYTGEYYLMQYTELRDSVGVKIYTSDIVETKYEIEGREYIHLLVKSHKEKGCYFIENDSNTVALWDALHYGTVIDIGSKYDNKSKFKKLELINNKVLYRSIDQREKKINDAVKKERINSIRRMINEGIGKQFIINMYSEEEFRQAMELENRI